MNKTLTLSIPHRLSADEARARIVKGVEDVKRQFAGKLADVDEQWNGNHMEFRLSAAGQAVTGRLDVDAEVVRLAVDLPWVLAMLANKVRPQVEQQARKMLEKK